MLLELTQMDERETQFREVFFIWVFFYLGFYKPEGFVRLRGQVNHEHKVQHTFKKHTRQLQTLSTTYKANNKQLQKSHEVLQVPMMLINAWYLGLVLFILGSWLAIVVDVFILLNSRFSRTLMAVGGEVAVSLSPGCWLGKCSFCKSSCITSHGCEVFEGIAEVCHWWHIRMTNLSNTSQATK
jgi:hypothetical protein